MRVPPSEDQEGKGSDQHRLNVSEGKADHTLGLGRVIDPLYSQSAAEFRRFDPGCPLHSSPRPEPREAWKSYDLVHILRRAPDGQS